MNVLRTTKNKYSIIYTYQQVLPLTIYLYLKQSLKLLITDNVTSVTTFYKLSLLITNLAKTLIWENNI